MGDNENLWLESTVESIKNFFIQLYTKKYTISDMLGEIQDKTLIEKLLFFFVGIEYNNMLFIYDESEWKKASDLDSSSYQSKDMQIADCFRRRIDLEKRTSGRCRCIGGIKKEKALPSEKDLKINVYYYVAADNSIIDLVFLQCAETEYYEWISQKLASYLNSVKDKEDVFGGSPDEEINKLKKNTSDTFLRYYHDVLNINIETITALSGVYYEGTPCHSDLTFLTTGSADGLKGITFTQPVEFSIKNIKTIRKLLAMGQAGQCLLVCKKNEGWMVQGLYEAGDFSSQGITFRIRGHMSWKMEVRRRLAVCYKCGEYIVESEEIELKKFEDKYREVFGDNLPDEVKKIYKEVMNQKHGAILIVIKQNKTADSTVKKEVKRLTEDSTGIEIEPCKMREKFASSTTSVDGALIIDDKGFCYGFGMILDGSENLKGNPERGARFNSTRKYIKTCKVKGMKVIGVVVSEDKMINIFSTNDDFEEESKDDDKEAGY